MKMIAAMLLFAASAFSAIPTDDTVTNYKGIKFKRIPAGTFEMGHDGRTLTSPLNYGGITDGFYNETPRRKVTITQDFYIGMYEVNRHQYSPSDPSTKPMGWITWAAANAFCDTMTAHDPNGWTYRLPTEAEWEYCCKAGTSTWFSTGDAVTTAQANIVAGWGASVTPVAVGSYAPNPWGLYDMHGNAEEWCLDWYGGYVGDSLVNPGGPATGYLKCIRSLGHYYIYVRSCARGALPPVLSPGDRQGFRVVISNLTRDSLNYYPNPDSLRVYQKRVAASRPAPATVVSGENYTDADGLSFTRVRMTRAGCPMQKDSVVYVSDAPVAGDSATDRLKAGLYAARLSGTYGVLYRLSNRYELQSAGIGSPQGFYLTLLPDIRYAAGRPHPDKAYYQARRSGTIPTPVPFVGGPVFHEVNHNSFIGECPNGDLIASWYSGTTEDAEEQVTAGNRLRLGENTWDGLASQMVDFPFYSDYTDVWRDNGKGVLYNYHATTTNIGGTWLRKSTDNGVTWGAWTFAFNHMVGKSMFQAGLDTLVTLTDGGGRIVRSTDGGDTWVIGTSNSGGGYHSSGAVLDDRIIIAFQRGATENNDSGRATMHMASTTNWGQTWTPSATPFFPADIGQYDVCLKLQSGRLLMASVCKTLNKGGVVLIESVDSGRTWFCRRKLDGNHGTPLFEGGYKDMCQGWDGVIHLQGTEGSGGGINAHLPQASFTEQWLREGTCLDVTEWGINTTGMVSPCPEEDTLLTGAEAVEKLFAPLLTAAPNPFNPSTVIRYSLPGSRPGTLSILNVKGERVFFAALAPGQGRTAWEAKGLPSGLYLAKLSAAGGLLRSVKLVRIR